MEERRSATTESMPIAGVLIPILFSMVAGFATPARGETLLIDDLKKAAAAKGCQSVPYQSPRVECNSIQDAIDKCKDALDGDPEKELARKKKTFNDIDKKQRSIDDIEKKQEAKQKELKSKPAALAVLMQDMDEQIDKLRREITDLATDQERREKALDIPKRVENGERCAHYRGGMREHFDDVMKMLKDRKSFSADAKASKEAQKYAEEIVEHIQSEVRGHKEQEDAWKNRAVAWQEVADLKP